MRYITADYIFPVSSPPLKNGMIITGDDGAILEVLGEGTEIDRLQIDVSAIESFAGIICPGFINTHCHLELSHLKNKLTEGKGLPHFIREIAKNRKAPEDEIKEAITLAENEMIKAGIVAVGDISNFNHSFEQKNKGRLGYHTFIEIFDLIPDQSDETFQQALKLVKQFLEMRTPDHDFDNTISITPHAPYTVTTKLFKLIDEYASHLAPVCSIHNQETPGENEMFLEGKGELVKTLSKFNSYFNNWQATGYSSLASIMGQLPGRSRIQLVHNTYTAATDIVLAHACNNAVWWCTCPNANLFIENKLPDYKIFMDAGCRMTVGTDSYASNWSLSILDELKSISRFHPEISAEILLGWATKNGAEYLGIDIKKGSIEKGKKPGLNLITAFNYDAFAFTENSQVINIQH
jgi:cytosine/adenosine deaminase-related metal-dependent hydrolase